MAYVTIEEAAKLTGKSVQSLYRHVKQGKVSKHHDGFDTAELMRVYGALRNLSDTTVNFDTFSNEGEVELSMLKRENELLRGNIEELRTDKQELYTTIKFYQSLLPAPEQQDKTTPETTNNDVISPNIVSESFTKRVFRKLLWLRKN